MLSGLQFFARHGRLVLVAGLLAGVFLPSLASTLKSYLPEMIALLLFISAFRVGPKSVITDGADIPKTVLIIAIYQIVTPLLLLFGFKLVGFEGPIAFAIVLMASAASIAGSANLVLLVGGNAAPALRLLVMGTALLPVTVIPVFYFLPEIGTVASILEASGRLLVLILGAAFTAFFLRHFFLPKPSEAQLQAIDGMSAITMSVVVVGLMAAVGPALNGDLTMLGLTLLAAFGANFGLQICFWFLLGAGHFKEERTAFSIIAGNRNLALFLTALPVTITDPILLFIGCYQIPMYLTPILLNQLYKKSARN